MSIPMRLALAVSAALPLAAVAQTPKPGGTLKIALRGDPATLDCHAISSAHVAFVLFPAYSTLLKFDAHAYPKIVGDLAQSWSVSTDGLQYTFKLQPNVKFHDGTPLTSKDVKASWDRMLNPPPGVVSLRKTQYADIKTVEAPDAQTVRFTLATRNSAMLTMFANPWNCIYSAAKLAQDPQFPQKTILGSGPFKLAEQTPGSRIVFEKNPNYFVKGQPYLDKLELIVLANAAVVPAISAGQVDADFFTFADPLRDQIAKARGDKTVFSRATTTTQAIVTYNTKKGALNDVRVRRALSLAIDRTSADQNLRRLASVADATPVYASGAEYALPAAQLRALPGYTGNIEQAREQAKQLLKDASAANLKLTLLAPNTRDPYEPYFIFLADSWRRIGVTVEIRALDAAAYQSAKTARDFDVVLEWNSSQSPHPIEVFEKYVPGSAGNYGGNDDVELTKLYQLIKRENDPKALRELAVKFQVRLLEQAWSSPLLWAVRTTATPSDLRGWKAPPTFGTGLDHATLWWDRR